MNYGQNYQNQSGQYEEIDLIDYLKIILKSKRTVLLFIIIGLIAAWAVTLSVPKKYKAETFLEIGNALNPLVLIEKINHGFYGSYSGLAAGGLEGTNLVRIGITSSNTKSAEDNLNRVNDLILKEDNKKLEDRKRTLEEAITELEKKTKSLSWKNQETGRLELEIYRVDREIKNSQPTQVIRKPTIIFSREPNLYLNLIFGAVLGGFVGIFTILSRDWWQKNKKRI